LEERSNAIASIRVPPSPRLNALATRLADALASGDRGRVQAVSQAVLDAYCAVLRVPRLHVEVEGTRPTNDYGELHGLYRPGNGRSADRVQVWMHTARRGQVVAFKTFLRTLLYELGHHLDYEYLKLPARCTRKASIAARTVSSTRPYRAKSKRRPRESELSARPASFIYKQPCASCSA
jgi:hypothetical protein